MKSSSHPTIELQPIGNIRTGYAALEDCPRAARFNPKETLIELDEGVAEGLNRVEESTHLIVLYWFHCADRSALLRQRGKEAENPRGVFASRSPNRPNPIAVSVVKLLGREGNLLRVSGLDCLDGTALIDLKPYVPVDDCIPDAAIHWDYPGPPQLVQPAENSSNPNACRCR